MQSRFNHVVKIYTISQEPDYDAPWQSESPVRSTGSGVVVASTLVLTGAHVVAQATFVEVQCSQSSEKFAARVKSICHDMDLALLEISDEKFSAMTKIAKIGELPALRDKVSVVGFPIGGEEVSITEGVVSRIEVQSYSHSQRNLLAVTVDAAINSGNSGGPVFKDELVVGIAFQKLSDGDADNIGEMVPVPLIQQFLAQAETQSDVKVPDLGIVTQTLENPVLRRFLKMTDKQSGLLINSVECASSVDGTLKEKDVLLDITIRDQKYVISNQGTVLYHDRYRTSFSAVLGEARVGEEIELGFLRKEELHTAKCTLKESRPLAPRSQYHNNPRFWLFGGLVFQPLSRNYLSSWGEKWWNQAPAVLYSAYRYGVRDQKREEIIVLSRVLGDQSTVGYQDLEYEVVKYVNGEQVRNLEHLKQLVDAIEGIMTIEFDSKALLTLDLVVSRAAHQSIMDKYRIPIDASLGE